MQKIGVVTKSAEAVFRAAALIKGGDDRLRHRSGVPRAAPDSVVVLQQGPNATTDYYLRPRLERLAGLPWTILDLTADPAGVPLFSDASRRPWVVLCRYSNERWLSVLERDRSRIARLSLLIDDDMRRMRRNRSLPLSIRGKLALGHTIFAERLSAILDDLWVSTSVLQERYPGSEQLHPLPDTEPALSAVADNRCVVHHASDAHAAERVFALEVAKLVVARGGDAVFEIAGDSRLKRSATGASAITIIPQTSWPVFRTAQQGHSAAIFMAPLADTSLNRARSHIKVYDAARLGAVGLFSDVEAYRSAVRNGVDGLLLPWDAGVWAQAVMDLLADPARRIRLTDAMRARISASRSSIIAAPFGTTEL